MSGTGGVASESADDRGLKSEDLPGQPADQSLPRTTARAVAVAATLGSLALLAVAPWAGVGTVAGVLVGTGVWRFTGGTRALLVASALLPVAGLLLIAGLVGSLEAADGSLGHTVLGVVTGLATVAAVTDIPSHELQRVGWVWLVGSLVVGGAALLAAGIWSAGGVLTFLAVGVDPFGTGPILTATAAVVAVAGALYAVPRAMIRVPRGSASSLSRRSILAGVVLLVVVAAFSSIGQRLLVVLTLLAVTVGLIGGVVKRSWTTADQETKTLFGWIMSSEWADGEMENPALGIILCLCGGSLLPLFAPYAAPEITPELQKGLGVTAIVLCVGGAVALVAARTDGSLPVPPATTLLAAALGGQAVAVAGQTEAGTVSAVDGVVTLAVLTAALFVYAAGQYGRTVTGEVGSATGRRPQLVWLGWSGLVGVVGLVVAATLYWIATTFTAVLSGPSRVGVLAGITALAAVTWLLLDR